MWQSEPALKQKNREATTPRFVQRDEISSVGLATRRGLGTRRRLIARRGRFLGGRRGLFGSRLRSVARRGTTICTITGTRGIGGRRRALLRVVGRVPSAALEHEGTRGNHPLDLAFAVRTFLERRLFDALHHLDDTALGTFVFVNRHSERSIR